MTPPRTAPIRVMVVDDSPVVRRLFEQLLGAQPDLELMAAASDPFAARDILKSKLPDVLILDIEMPRMDGLTFLAAVMAQRPLPVIICSGMAGSGSAAFARALELGAVDIIPKPSRLAAYESADFGAAIAESIRGAAAARMDRSLSMRSAVPRIGSSAAHLGGPTAGGTPLIAIGASTGGTEAIARIVERMPADCPPMLIVQHMPAGFTRLFAERLNGLGDIRVAEARGGEDLLRGRALVAPGDRHMRLERTGAACRVDISFGELVNRHRPSVDVLFLSVAELMPDAVGVLLTGMGRDGARGLLEMRKRGSLTFAQDDRSSVVFGMPAAAIEIGAAARIAAPEQIADALISPKSIAPRRKG